jgi:quercetin dioxygenase-like cupin family protein
MKEPLIMNTATVQSTEANSLAILSARTLAPDRVPWVPLSGRKSFKPLRFLSGNRGFVELLRLEPGEAIPLHRHTGDVHAINLEGSRELCTGEIIGPGDYVYEPAGNTDSWKVVGNKPLVVLVVVMGAVEYLGPENNVTNRFTADTLMECYRQYCASNNIEPLDLVD